MNRVCTLAAVCLLTSGGLRPPLADAAEPLFNGKSLAGWWSRADAKPVWGAEDGVIVLKAGGGGWLMHERELSDFELTFSYKMAKGANSGVCLRAPLAGDPAYQGMEIQLIDEDNWKDLKPTQFTGSIYDIVGPSKKVTRPFGEWNQMKIVCKGRRVQVELNGTPTVDADLDAYPEKVKTHPGLKRTGGHVGFQSYNVRVEFKDVVVAPQ